MKRVNVIIAGGQKCGTTACFEFLKSHPKIIGSIPKETDFFSYDFRFKKGYSFYHDFFHGNPHFKFLRRFKYLEASPSYLTENNVLETARRIYEYNNDMKIICLVRNPIDRAFSAWQMYRNRFLMGMEDWYSGWIKKNTGKMISFQKRTSKEYQDFFLFLKCELECNKNNILIECPVLPQGEYSKGIKVFKKIFHDNFKLVTNEQLNANTPETLASIADFCGLDTYDWEKFNNKKLFKGNYNEKIDKQSYDFLYSYYKLSNEYLSKKYKINYHDKT